MQKQVDVNIRSLQEYGISEIMEMKKGIRRIRPDAIAWDACTVSGNGCHLLLIALFPFNYGKSAISLDIYWTRVSKIITGRQPVARVQEEIRGMPMEGVRDMYLPGPDHPDTVSGGILPFLWRTDVKRCS